MDLVTLCYMTYRIAGNFGEVFNLVIGEFGKKIAKLETHQYRLLHVCLGLWHLEFRSPDLNLVNAY